jgi:hypothetical protein
MAAALLLALALDAGQPVEYVREGGFGTLTMTPAGNGAKAFELSTFGANAHDCSLSGTIKGDIGKTNDTEPGQPECRIAFAQKGNMIEVTPQTPEACREYCGARASFDGKFYLPPPACTQGASQQAKDAFLSQYKARNYAQAYEGLNAWFGTCSFLVHWIDADRVRNDLALAQYHMKQPAACMATLANTVAAKAKTLKALEEELPPVEWDSYAPTAKATFYNMKLCSK